MHGTYRIQIVETGKREAFCKCGFDKTISGLSETEAQYARFYVLTQVGVDVQSTGLITKVDTEAMIKASNAIGSAVNRCG
ncbi:MAG: hypothetical protein WBC71_02005 [Salaquimonas sp.]